MLEFNRRDIKAMIMGPKPPKGPEGKNVLWMDTSVSTFPILKIFENGAWTTVHTKQDKVDGLLLQIANRD